MKLLIGLLLAVFLTGSEARTLVIGTTPDKPPFSASADGKNNFYGFEIDLMTQICSRLQADCRFQAVDLKDVIRLLDEDKIDLAIAEISPPIPGSLKTGDFIFSAPYFLSSGQFLVRADASLKTLQDLRHKTVGVRFNLPFGETLFEDFLMELYNKQLTIKVYPTLIDLVDALNERQVEAIFTNTQSMNYWNTHDTNKFQLLGEPFPIGNGYCVMGKKGDELLITKISQAIYEMQQDGTYMKIYKHFFTLG